MPEKQSWAEWVHREWDANLGSDGSLSSRRTMLSVALTSNQQRDPCVTSNLSEPTNASRSFQTPIGIIIDNSNGDGNKD
jgi:hypothetical protein